MQRFFKVITILVVMLNTLTLLYASTEELHSTLTREILISAGRNASVSVNADGMLMQSNHYHVYGAINKMYPIGDQNNKAISIQQNPFQYNHEYLDQESGLYYLRARYYSPSFQRFIQRDSYNLLNRYNYADDNPVMNVDPSGHFALVGFILSQAVFLAVNVLQGMYPKSKFLQIISPIISAVSSIATYGSTVDL